MRLFLAALFAIHGIAHLPGFTLPWRLTGKGLPVSTTILAGAIDLGPAGIKTLGLLWLAVAIAMIVTAVAIARSVPDWSTPALVVVAVSTVLAILGWPAAKLGLVINLALGLILVLGRRGGWLPNAGAQDVTVDGLWRRAPPSVRRFDPVALTALPEPAQRYLRHAIAPDTPLATAVRLIGHGDIKLGRTWRTFTSEQVILANRGMIWEATVAMGPVSIRGSDRIVDGQGGMRWRLGGLVPVIGATGTDVTRSGIGRLIGEAIWLPSWLVGATWDDAGCAEARYRLTLSGEVVAPSLTLAADGAVTSARLTRWGNPDGRGFRALEFGVIAEQERTFGGYTIPTRIRAGWHFGTERFEREGEFFRFTIDRAEFATGPAREPARVSDDQAALLPPSIRPTNAPTTPPTPPESAGNASWSAAKPGH